MSYFFPSYCCRFWKQSSSISRTTRWWKERSTTYPCSSKPSPSMRFSISNVLFAPFFWIPLLFLTIQYVRMHVYQIYFSKTFIDLYSYHLFILQETEVNLIITDYCMPGMTGYELLRKIKVNYQLFRRKPNKFPDVYM